ncbi:Bug family tripartite tricarboxylate transporter substrate binding protein [Cupriavidus basilensis]
MIYISHEKLLGLSFYLNMTELNCNFSTERRTLVRAGLAGIAASVLPMRVSATPASESLSAGAVRIVVPHTAGTTPDYAARLLGPKLSAHFDRPFVVDNRPGASGLIGYEAVSNAKPDGKTLMLTAASLMTIKLLYPSARLNPLDDFVPISLICSSNFALVTSTSLPVQNFSQFLAYVKSRPGQLDYASPGKGTFQHLWMEQMSQLAGLQMIHVPYKGAAGATTDLVAGHVKALFMPVHVAMPLYMERKIKVLGVISAGRDSSFPTVATLSEAGLPGFSGDAWYAMLGQNGLRPEIIRAYEEEIRSMLSTSELRMAFGKQGVNVRFGSSQELRQIMRVELDKWSHLIKSRSFNVQHD